MDLKEIKKIIPTVNQIRPTADRPRWSVMIPVYNPKEYIIEAFESILNQYPDSENMQIEVVDDCSDKVEVESIVKNYGRDRITYHRNIRNLGHSNNFTECVRRAKGELVHILHDDDSVKPGFYRKFEEIFDTYKTIGAAYCRQEYIDDNGKYMFDSEPDMEEQGILENAVIRLAEKQRVQYCAMVVKREAYEKAGGFITKNIGCEDWEMWVRLASKFEIAYTPEILARYRIHRTSMTLTDMRTGQDMRFLREAADIFTKYLPFEKRDEVTLFRNKHYAVYSFNNAKRMYEEFNDEEGAAAQLSETIKLDSEIVYNNLDLIKDFKIPIESAGVSVLIFTNNDEATIEKTLLQLINQRVPEFIPWEIILLDIGSKDNTISIATESWLKYKRDTPFKIIRLGNSNVESSLKTALSESKYEFILFCNPGNLLNINYIRNVSENFLKETYLGAMAAPVEYSSKSVTNDWFDEWTGKGKQFDNINTDYRSFHKWYKGHSGIAIRRNAFEKLILGNFKFQYSNKKIKSNGADKELLYAIKLSDWNIRSAENLQLKIFVPEESDSGWNFIRKQWKQYGEDSVLLSPYLKIKKDNTEDLQKVSDKLKRLKNIKYFLRKSLKQLRKLPEWKLRLYDETFAGDKDFSEIEYHFGKMRQLLQFCKSYNQKLRILKDISRKRDFKFLKYIIDEPGFRFPHYKNNKSKLGISVVLIIESASYSLVMKSVEKITNQKLRKDFPWELVVFNTLSESEFDFDVKGKIEKYLKNSGSTVNAKFVSKEEGINAVKQKSRYEYLILLNENCFLHTDFVRIAYKVISNNKMIGVLTGRKENGSEVNTPKWFKEYKSYFGIGNEPKESGFVNSEYRYNFNEGIVLRKKLISNINIKEPTQLNSIISEKYKIYYEQRLRIDKFIPVKNFKWENLRDINYNIGLENKDHKYVSKLNGSSNISDINKSRLSRINRTISEIRKYPLKKIFSKKSEFANDTEVLEIERLRGKLIKIINDKERTKIVKEDLRKLVTSNTSLKDKNNIEGVSIVICCYNSSKVLPQTLKYLFRQKKTENIPWEIIIVDNASTDNTARLAENLWADNNCMAPLITVKEDIPGLSAARQKGIETARYEYVIFCDDDNRLEENFVRYTYELMTGNKEIGILGGQSKAEFETLPKFWFKDWKNSYATGKQSEKEGDITWTRGFVWGAAMVVRKEAWKKIKEKGFRSLLTDRKGNTLSAGGDTEICYAVRNEGWKIWYDSRLRFKHYITSERMDWNYLRKLFKGFGNASVGLDEYLRKVSKNRNGKYKFIPKSDRAELHKALRILRKTRYKKLLTYKQKREGDTDIPMIEYASGRIESLIRKQGSYNRGIKFLKKTCRKKDYKYLTSVFKDNFNDFPKYKIEKKLNGVSIIVCTYNGAQRLADTIRHIAKQKVDSNILWELVLVDNASSDNSKEVTKAEWKKHDCNARLKIVDQPIPGKQLALEKGYEVAKYEYWITCDDDNWLDENFVQLTYEIMSSNEKIGALGGPNEALCELPPPDWFKWFQKDYAAGPQGDIYTGKVSDGDITWKRGYVWGAGMIVRKSAWQKLIADGFKTSMSCRKGTELSSGGDSEACYALVLAGWHIWYDKRLKLKHCMPAGRLEWDYLIRLFSGFGVATVGLELYEKAIKLGYADKDGKEILNQNWKYEFKRALKELKKYGLKKIFSLRHSQENNTEIPMVEFYLAKVKELWKDRKEYDNKFEEIKKATWKKSFSELKSEHRKYLESENDFRYGWPWKKESFVNFSENKKYFPKISILTPSFNSAGTIEKAILSVLNQGYPNFEHIITDAGSIDGTVDILKKYPHLKWVSEPDKGQSDAMNKAFDMSDGEVISYLNADDYYSRGAFNEIAKEFTFKPETEMVVGNLYFEYGNHTYLRNAEIDYRKIMLPFKYMFPINPVSYFYRRKVQTDVGPFPIDNHYTMDYWFLLKAYQNHKLYKTEYNLGTFCMNGYNKTSNADNRKNTHIRVVYHCRKYDLKNLPYYLYNYYKFFYYDKKPYNLKNLKYKLRKNAGRIKSILTLKKNKYYNEKLYTKARNDYYARRRIRASFSMLASFIIYPKSVKQNSRLIMFSYAVTGLNYTEKLKWFYNFLTTPPGLPLANKLHYYGNKFISENKSIKGNSLLVLTYIISPKFLFKADKNFANPNSIESNESKLGYLNPLNWIKGFVNYFRYKTYKDISYNYYLKAGEKYYFHKNLQAVYFMILAFLVYPLSVTKKSRLNLFAYSFLGNTLTDKFKYIYHLYKDDPEYTFAYKLNYHGNELRKEGSSFKGNSILIFAYILSPKYIKKREKINKSKIIYASEYEVPKMNISGNRYSGLKQSGVRLKNSLTFNGSLNNKIRNTPEIVRYKFVQIYHYFKYRKFKAKSKELYMRAQESYIVNKRFDTVKFLIPSFILYPVSIFKRNKWSLMINSILGNNSLKKAKGNKEE